MKYLSLFAGVHGLDLGDRHDVVGFCEIDDKAASVLGHHHPDVPLWRDVTTLDTKEVTTHVGRVDLVAGGSPCQDLSVAGRRGGLDGARSGLFWHQCRIADELAAPWVVWENVAGAFSSNDGADFAAVLWGLTGTHPVVPDGGWKSCGVVVGPKRTAVWRLLDAQWFGVAQRRRRVFVVAGPRGECGPEVLALGESVSGHPRPSRTPGPADTGSLGTGAQSDLDNRRNVVGSLTAMKGWERPDNAHAEAGWLVPTVHAAFDSTWSGRYPISGEDLSPTVKVGSGFSPPAVAFSAKDHGADAIVELSPTLRAGGFDTSHMNGGVMPAIASDLAVRRLTPRECERLMGWPDDHTRYVHDGTEIADSHRYRMCGNGVATPVARWIGGRLPA